MDKKYLLILLALFLLLIISKRSKAAPKPSPVPDDIQPGWASTFRQVQKGDTLYKITSDFWDEPRLGPPTRDKILNFARQQAYANGFNWDKYDDVPTADILDPDTLQVGQKLVMYSWGSFFENDPRTGAIMPGQQINAFNSWEIL
jgi:hypothetical protein